MKFLRRCLIGNPQFEISNDEAGFTLIELLVALSILSIVAVAFGSVLRSGLTLWRRSEKDMRLIQEAQGVLDLMGQEFRNAIDVPGVTWSASNEGVSFATVKEGERIVKISYQLTPNSRVERDLPSGVPSIVLSHREQDFSPDRPGTEKVATLTSSPTQIQWEYAYALNTAKSAVRWEQDWTTRDSLPCGIRIHLTLYDGNALPQKFTRTLFSPTRDLTIWNN
jgi:prepilin-type N-terminal cleavage/methylation domain-containing protein